MTMTMPSPRTQFRTSTDLDEIVRCSELIHQCGMHALPFAFEHAASPVPIAVFAADGTAGRLRNDSASRESFGAASEKTGEPH